MTEITRPQRLATRDATNADVAKIATPRHQTTIPPLKLPMLHTHAYEGALTSPAVTAKLTISRQIRRSLACDCTSLIRLFAWIKKFRE